MATSAAKLAVAALITARLGIGARGQVANLANIADVWSRGQALGLPHLHAQDGKVGSDESQIARSLIALAAFGLVVLGVMFSFGIGNEGALYVVGAGTILALHQVLRFRLVGSDQLVGAYAINLVDGVGILAAISLVVFWQNDPGLGAVLLAYLVGPVGALLLGLVLVLVLTPVNRPSRYRDVPKQYRTSFDLGGASLLQFATNRADLALAPLFLSYDTIGIYANSLATMQASKLLAQVIGSSAYADTALDEAPSDVAGRNRGQLLALGWATGAVLLAGGLLVGPVLFGDSARSVGYGVSLALLAIANGPFLVSTVASQRLLAINCSSKVVRAETVGLATNILLLAIVSRVSTLAAVSLAAASCVAYVARALTLTAGTNSAHRPEPRL